MGSRAISSSFIKPGQCILGPTCCKSGRTIHQPGSTSIDRLLGTASRSIERLQLVYSAAADSQRERQPQHQWVLGDAAFGKGRRRMGSECSLEHSQRSLVHAHKIGRFLGRRRPGYKPRSGPQRQLGQSTDSIDHLFADRRSRLVQCTFNIRQRLGNSSANSNTRTGSSTNSESGGRRLGHYTKPGSTREFYRCLGTTGRIFFRRRRLGCTRVFRAAPGPACNRVETRSWFRWRLGNSSNPGSAR